MLATASPTFLPRVRLTFSSRRRAMVGRTGSTLFRNQTLIVPLDLINYCAKENVPFTVFEDWSSILEKVKELVAGKTTVHEAAKEGYEAYKRGEAGVGEAAK